MLEEAVEGTVCVLRRRHAQPGARLVCVNGAFERLTGYGRDFAVGRNCRFLQGADTEPAAVQQLVEALRDARPTAVELTNYRRDGSAFRNALVVSPVHDSSGAYRYSLALLADAASRSMAGGRIGRGRVSAIDVPSRCRRRRWRGCRTATSRSTTACRRRLRHRTRCAARSTKNPRRDEGWASAAGGSSSTCRSARHDRRGATRRRRRTLATGAGGRPDDGVVPVGERPVSPADDTTAARGACRHRWARRDVVLRASMLRSAFPYFLAHAEGGAKAATTRCRARGAARRLTAEGGSGCFSPRAVAPRRRRRLRHVAARRADRRRQHRLRAAHWVQGLRRGRVRLAGRGDRRGGGGGDTRGDSVARGGERHAAQLPPRRHAVPQHALSPASTRVASAATW